uniref:Uncharacterized protein n=1 Tax=Arundo donax TaxID=35708 RepID=A0A0A8YVI7_ARUDO
MMVPWIHDLTTRSMRAQSG